MMDTAAAIRPKFTGRMREESWGGMVYISGRSYDLINDTGHFLLQRCDGTHTISDIAREMAVEYEVPYQQVLPDIFAALNSMARKRIVTWDGLELGGQPDKPLTGVDAGLATLNARDLIKEPGILGMGEYALSAPMKILIEFTRNCNLRCVHCFADADCNLNAPQGRTEGDLDTETWFRVIDNVANAGVFNIFVSGGEPLMRDDIFDICQHITEKGIDWCFLTNMTLLDVPKAQRLKDLGCMKVEGNLDGPDAASYDAFRGCKGAFDATVRGIRACQEVGLPFRLNVTVTKLNVRQLPDIIRTAVELGVPELACVPLEPGGRGLKNAQRLEITPEEHNELVPFYTELDRWAQETYGDRLVFVPPMGVIGSNHPTLDILDPNKIMPPCGAGRFHCCISPTGKVILCPSADEDIPINPCDATTMDMKTIWRDADVFQVMRQVQPGCPACDDPRCGGGCQVRVFQKYGRVGAGPDPLCDFMRQHLDPKAAQ